MYSIYIYIMYMYIHKYMHVYMYQHTRVCAPKKDSKHFDSCCTYRILLHGFQLQCQELWLEVLYLVLHFCIAEALAMAEAFAIFFRPVAVEHGGFVQQTWSFPIAHVICRRVCSKFFGCKSAMDHQWSGNITQISPVT